MYDEKDDLDDLQLDPAILEGLSPEELAEALKQFEEFKDRLRAKRRARDREKAKRGDLSDADLEDLSEYATKEFGRLINVWLAHKMSVGASINANITYPRFGVDGKVGSVVGDQLTLRDGKIIACHIVKPETGAAINPAFVKEALKAMDARKYAASVTLDERSPMSKAISRASLGALLSLLTEYRSARADQRLGIHEKSLEIIDKMGDKGNLKTAELIPDEREPGKYYLDVSKIKESGILKVPHLDKDGKPTGEFDIVVHDKTGKIIDGQITAGSSLNTDTKNAVREAVLDKEMQGVNKANPAEVTAAQERAAVASGLSNKDISLNQQLSLEDELIARSRPIGMGGKGKAEVRGAEEALGVGLAALDNAGARRDRNVGQGQGHEHVAPTEREQPSRQASEERAPRPDQPPRETHAEPEAVRETRQQELTREPSREPEHRPSEPVRSAEPAQRPREQEAERLVEPRKPVEQESANALKTTLSGPKEPASKLEREPPPNDMPGPAAQKESLAASVNHIRADLVQAVPQQSAKPAEQVAGKTKQAKDTDQRTRKRE